MRVAHAKGCDRQDKWLSLPPVATEGNCFYRQSGLIAGDGQGRSFLQPFMPVEAAIEVR